MLTRNIKTALIVAVPFAAVCMFSAGCSSDGDIPHSDPKNATKMDPHDRINQIQGDASLSDAEKARRIQLVKDRNGIK